MNIFLRMAFKEYKDCILFKAHTQMNQGIKLWSFAMKKIFHKIFKSLPFLIFLLDVIIPTKINFDKFFHVDVMVILMICLGIIFKAVWLKKLSCYFIMICVRASVCIHDESKWAIVSRFEIYVMYMFKARDFRIIVLCLLSNGLQKWLYSFLTVNFTLCVVYLFFFFLVICTVYLA